VQHGNGNGKRWLLIGLLVLGGFWLVNDAYDDGYRDALVQSGQAQTIRHYRGGPDFPWGLLILGGIGYVAWRKGAFDRFGGPGGPFGNGGNSGQRGVQRFGAGYGPAQAPGAAAGYGGGPVFRGPRAFFEEWHRQAHEEAARAQYAASAAPPAPPAGAPGANHDAAQGGFAATPPPTPPAPEYWASMAGAAQAAGTPNATATPPAAPEERQGERPDAPRGATGTAV
jgi:hypothetical protein